MVGKGETAVSAGRHLGCFFLRLEQCPQVGRVVKTLLIIMR